MSLGEKAKGQNTSQDINVTIEKLNEKGKVNIFSFQRENKRERSRERKRQNIKYEKF